MSKVDTVRMSSTQVAAGRNMWQRTGQVGRLTTSSFDAESMAPKTWILCVNEKGERITELECELYVVGRVSNASEGVGMLHGMCPKCGETFLVREDNKEMTVDRVKFRKAPKFLREAWSHHCRTVLRKPIMDDDLLPVISSGEPWLCDYCKEWGVRVSGGVAVPDMTRVHKIVVDMKGAVLISKERGKIEL